MSQNLTWRSEEDEMLIDFVKNHAALFNIKSKEYKKFQLKQNLWLTIGDILKRTDVDCSKRWAYVRDYYIRRRGKLGTGSSGEAAKRRSDLLSFLDGFSSSQRSSFTNVVENKNSEDINVDENLAIEIKTQVDNEESNIAQVETISEEEKTENISSEHKIRKDYKIDKQKRKKPLHSEERMQLYEQIARRNITYTQDRELDETDYFFISMSKIVKKLPRYEQAELRMQISTLVGNAELRQVLNRGGSSESISKARCLCVVTGDTGGPNPI